MKGAACAAGTDGEGGDAVGEGEIGVGGADAGFGGDVEVAVDGAKASIEGAIGGQAADGSVADAVDGQGELVEAGGLARRGGIATGTRFREGQGGRVEFCGQGREHGEFEAIQFEGRGGTEIQLGGGAFRDGVDGGSAMEGADVEGGARVGGEGDAGDGEQGGAEGEDGVGAAGVCPGVAAGAGDGDAKAAAAEGAVDDEGVAGAFERDDGGGGEAEGLAGKKVAYAAEVAGALFAHVGGEQDGQGRLQAGVLQGGSYREESGEAGRVVTGAWTEDAGAVF